MSRIAPTSRVLSSVFAERRRQDMLVATGKHPFHVANPDIPDGGKLMVLGEEFGEVSRAAYDCYYTEVNGPTTAQREHLREELIQLAAVAVAWVESIDNE